MSRREALSGRLSRLKKDGLAPPQKKTDDQKEKISFGLSRLDGWVEIEKHLWKRSVIMDNPLAGSYPESLILPPGSRSIDFLFYDTETTGLSTGAGTIPFLVGIGAVKNKKMEIIQYFLSDYPGEIHMLKELNRLFDESRLFISYNGKTYDSHLLNTRLLMNGFSVPYRNEIDLLYTSRRLWKTRLENCRLGTIEQKILNITRGPDIPGSEIPDVWFDFLKDGRTERLERVFSHNVQDIHSLAVLLNTVENIISESETDLDYDQYALGRLLLFYGRESGIGLLQKEFHRGNRKAGEFLSLYWKRKNNWKSAVDLWEKMNSNGFNLFSVEELAKYYEHRERNYKKALYYVDRLLKGPISPSGEIKERLIHRKKRLVSKI